MYRSLPILFQSYWIDEAWSVLISKKSLAEIFLLSVRDVHPPLYYFILHFWILMFGDAEHSTRMLSFTFHVGLAVVVYTLIRSLVIDRKAALIGSMIVFFQPYLVYYAFDTTSYSMYFFLVVLLAYFALRKKYLLCSMTASLLILTHNIGVLYIIPVITYVLLKLRHSKGWLDAIKEILRSFTSVIFVFLVWLPFFIVQFLRVSDDFWVRYVSVPSFFSTLSIYFIGAEEYGVKNILLWSTICWIGGFLYWFKKMDKKNDSKDKNKEITLIFVCTVFPLAIGLLVDVVWMPVFFHRYFAPTAPFLIVIEVYSIVQLMKHNSLLQKVVPVFLIVYLGLLSIASVQITLIQTKSPIKTYIQSILSNVKSGDIIIPMNYWNYLPVKYYVQQNRTDVEVYLLNKDNRNIPFFLGKGILFDDNEILLEEPVGRRIWYINDGGTYTMRTL